MTLREADEGEEGEEARAKIAFGRGRTKETGLRQGKMGNARREFRDSQVQLKRRITKWIKN